MRIQFVIMIIFLTFAGCEKTDNGVYSTQQTLEEFQISDSIPVPTLYGGKFIESPGYGLHWTASLYGYMYQLVSSPTDSFPSSITVYQGLDRELTVKTNTEYYRVRAYTAGYSSRWSNVVKP